ncbi:hypothetical protein GLOIN_2v1786535 [Rhizophagus irregularis DAOM 181602=DAOM 197198]|uniref:Uncharacterized protein n=1 Tax=Rhizophagus irregularis (strain DAOM 181602 / DAOM 197198 / MUCL 43194) TaxID=747089 RepID=A0A2P4P7Z1_RHIID|nr:hypothetical protein GLOIN_2v1786535 [Rhizophagus irregularis DAOM 181602=DAOM 197198]POG61505.1 hypothetical protein GLOIN_2v1786535 [Rhizophagus irregularis DAOM 181602=DAOM 197198]GET66735.1 hypothetical protein GLOIN_2v1786535 [Rhizophagus irregularis DAOM 181602=DAOM 197198]|eukprot:XP_025168371.1 hypothetical protein GLOIN_2v1786535 [Rhizophagus irregularis DAOM 181602=DAOM 197198]
MDIKKKRKAQTANYLIENNDKYICRYPEKELVRILKESGYHSEEWKETDSDEENDIQSTLFIVTHLGQSIFGDYKEM